MLRPLLALTFTLLLAACDTSVPDDTAGPQEFEVSGVPGAADVELTDADTLALPTFTGPSSPTVAVGAIGSAVSATRDGDRVVVRALALGEGAVTFTAQAAGYRDTTVSVAVRVVPGVCPPGSPAGARDFFPVVDGTVWTFDVEEYTGGGWSSPLGMTATFRLDPCVRAVRGGRVTYRTGGATGFSETIPFAEGPDNRVSFATTSLFVPSNRVTFDRYAATSESVLRVPLSVCASAPPMDFGDGVGLVREDFTCRGPAQQYFGRRITRTP